MPTSEERLFGGYTGRMLALLSVGLAAARLGRRVLPPLLPTIITDLSITPFQAGMVLSLAAVAFALLQFPSGRLSDRLTRKTVLLSSLLVLVVGSLLLFTTTTFLFLLASAGVLGVGEGLYGAADRGLLSDLFVERRGVAFGVHGMFSDVGGIAAAGLAAGALALGVWQTAFLPAVAGLVVIAVLLYRWGREPVVLSPVSLRTRETAGRLVGQRPVLWIVLAYSLFAGASEGVIGFLPALLQADQGFSPAVASTVFAAMFATGLVARPLAGRLSDRRNRLVVAGMGLVGGAIGLALLVSALSLGLTVVGVVVFAVGQRAFSPSMQAYLMDTFPDASMAGDFGAMRTVYVGVGSVGPAYVGYVAGLASYRTAFVGFVVAFVVSGAIVLGLALTD